MKTWLERHGWKILLGIASLAVLIPLLRPGYILTLDMIFAPIQHLRSYGNGRFLNGFPLAGTLFLLSNVIPGWIVQKLVFITLFVSLPLFAYRSLPLPRERKDVRAFAALFFLLNPFVYERMLAGQWSLLFGYALFPVVLGRTTPLVKAIVLAIIFLFSLHLGVMALLIVGVQTVVNDGQRTWKDAVCFIGTFAILTAYWTIPLLVRTTPTIISIFDARHLEAFKTAGTSVLGTTGSVLALYGFWGERYPWAQQWIWPTSFPWIWIPAGIVLAALILIGIFTTLRNCERRRTAIVLTILAVLATIFSCGAGDTIFRPFNLWLFDHIPFWRGFRDSQKWTAILALTFAYFGAMGFERVGRNLEGWRRTATISLAFSAVLFYTFPMLFGFWNQLRPVWYPSSWAQVNDMLRKDPQCKAIFLPWHSYYSLAFNHQILTASPASFYFSCEMMTSREVEIGDVEQQSLKDPAYDAIDGALTERSGLSPTQSVELLRSYGIRYVIFSHDLIGEDPWSYAFLDQAGLKKIDLPDLTLYELF